MFLLSSGCETLEGISKAKKTVRLPAPVRYFGSVPDKHVESAYVPLRRNKVVESSLEKQNFVAYENATRKNNTATSTYDSADESLRVEKNQEITNAQEIQTKESFKPAPLYHRVISGDTMYSIARRYEVDLWELHSVNGIGADSAISVDIQLRIPGKYSKKPAATKLDSMASMDAESTGERKISAIRNSETGASEVDTDESNETFRANEMLGLKVQKSLKKAPYDLGGRFLNPLAGKGKIISRYGFHGNVRNDGIDIQVPEGSSVYAADDGQIVFITPENGPLASVILVQHKGNWISVYGHVRSLGIKKGQKIKRGDRLAEVAKIGEKSSVLHFELRRGTQTADPELFF
jgi:murein DD-endopeptidase MepM/ murein hydrolase activator NlpD